MIRLRPYKACDAATIVSWNKDEISFRKWCADRYENYPITADDMNKHYNNLSYEDNFYKMTAYDETGIIGHLIMRFTDDEKSILRFGFVIIDDSKRGMGYGRQMLELAIKYAFDILKVKKITLGVFENNRAAYNCYKAVGFYEVQKEEQEYYHILNEDWLCIELELVR